MPYAEAECSHHLPLCSPTTLELLLRWSQIELMTPESGMLLGQPQIRLTNSFSSNVLPALRVIVVGVGNTSIRDRMHDLNPLWRHLPRERLCQLSDARSRCSVGCVLGLRGWKGKRSA